MKKRNLFREARFLCFSGGINSPLSGPIGGHETQRTTETTPERTDASAEAAETLLSPEETETAVREFQESVGRIGGWLMENEFMKSFFNEDKLKSVFSGREKCTITAIAVVLMGGVRFSNIKGVKDSLGPLELFVKKMRGDLENDEFFGELLGGGDEEGGDSEAGTDQQQETAESEESTPETAAPAPIEWGTSDFNNHLFGDLSLPPNNQKIELKFNNPYTISDDKEVAIELNESGDELILPEGKKLTIRGEEVRGAHPNGTKFDNTRGERTLRITGTIPEGVIIKGRPVIALNDTASEEEDDSSTEEDE